MTLLARENGEMSDMLQARACNAALSAELTFRLRV